MLSLQLEICVLNKCLFFFSFFHLGNLSKKPRTDDNYFRNIGQSDSIVFVSPYLRNCLQQGFDPKQPPMTSRWGV